MSNRSKFADAIAAAVPSLTKKAADDLLVTLTGVLRAHLLAEGEAVLPGFGRLKIETRAARRGHNPKTGEQIDIPAKEVIKFKAFPSA